MMRSDGTTFRDRSACTQLIIKCTMHIKLKYENEFLGLGPENFLGRLNFVQNKLAIAELDLKTQMKDWTTDQPGGKSSESIR